MIALDLPAGLVEVRQIDVVRLRDTAGAKAGRSSAARDLSLLLERALAGGRIALRRSELQTLIEVAAAAGLDDVCARLRDSAGFDTPQRRGIEPHPG